MLSLSRILAVSAALFTTAQAHFTLDYPPARGPYVGQEELKFCSGYPTQSNNRSLFPISDGMIQVNARHDTSTWSHSSASATPTNGAELLRLSPVAVLAFAGALFAAAL
ncbi:hypothetical protein M407DRAFT_10802 [Tulasnella calospora MUT 4182]|uniref:Copper acquisition factor BIM1-like domain-containing protein n=1 Tax=Tulasnella calospora MUT 4182 TaxID=1051891 RepID=A0A0C3KGG0_9AGAM|nr:hypothetical protein M407DRAFT_10802 [Tulasnella calospora MUT 4182]